MMKAIGYCRVSTESQASEGVSLAAQEAKIRAWALANDVELIAIYVDAGLSGKRSDNRPELQKALEHVCSMKGVLVVYSLSRLARSTKDTITIADRLEKAGADLASLSEKIDTTSAAGKMLFRLLAVLAEFESDQISERTKLALKHKKFHGRRTGGHVPFGFDLAGDGDTLLPNPAEQDAIKLMSELRGCGKSYREIAGELTRRGVRTKTGQSEWQHTAVVAILKNAI